MQLLAVGFVLIQSNYQRAPIRSQFVNITTNQRTIRMVSDKNGKILVGLQDGEKIQGLNVYNDNLDFQLISNEIDYVNGGILLYNVFVRQLKFKFLEINGQQIMNFSGSSLTIADEESTPLYNGVAANCITLNTQPILNKNITVNVKIKSFGEKTVVYQLNSDSISSENIIMLIKIYSSVKINIVNQFGKPFYSSQMVFSYGNKDIMYEYVDGQYILSDVPHLCQLTVQINDQKRQIIIDSDSVTVNLVQTVVEYLKINPGLFSAISLYQANGDTTTQIKKNGSYYEISDLKLNVITEISRNQVYLLIQQSTGCMNLYQLNNENIYETIDLATVELQKCAEQTISSTINIINANTKEIINTSYQICIDVFTYSGKIQKAEKCLSKNVNKLTIETLKYQPFIHTIIIKVTAQNYNNSEMLVNNLSQASLTISLSPITTNQSKSKNNNALVIGLSFTVFTILTALYLLIFFIVLKKKQNQVTNQQNNKKQNQLIPVNNIPLKLSDLQKDDPPTSQESESDKPDEQNAQQIQNTMVGSTLKHSALASPTAVRAMDGRERARQVLEAIGALKNSNLGPSQRLMPFKVNTQNKHK